eukprot:scaffold11633_cov63-Skeletonema_dohrnii-CCMP3373.AAC.2
MQSPPASSPASAQDDGLTLTVDSIFVGKEFRTESFSQPRWWETGSCYTALVKAGKKPITDLRGSNNDVSSSTKESDTAKTSSSGGGPPRRDLVWHDVATNTTETY